MKILIAGLAGCITAPRPVEKIVADLEGLPIDEFFEESYKQLLLRDPQKLTERGISKKYGLRNDQLTNMSDAYIRETQKLEAEVLVLLRKYKRESLTVLQKVSYNVYEWYLDDLVRGHTFMYYTYPLHHFLGSYHDELIRFFTEFHTIADKQDAEDYITRLSQVSTQVDQVIEGLKIRETKGIIPPTCIIELIQKVITNYLHGGSEDTEAIDGSLISLYTVFEENLKKINVTAEEKEEFLDSARKEIETSFIPAYLRLLDYVEHLGPLATDEAGVWKFPRGDEYYKYVLRKETSTGLTPEEIHNMGLKEIIRIQKEMRYIFDELQYPQDAGLTELMERVVKEGGTYDTSTQHGKDRVVKAYEDILKEADERLKAAVALRPRAQLKVVGETQFGGGGGYYVSGSLDGSRPGVFHTGVGGSFVYRCMMSTIAYHEGIPGHHFQAAVARELDLPLFRNVVFFNGYSEGWALYAERLAWELGLYKDNPYGNLGRLQLELLRAVRLVTDTGIHAMKWTREHAAHYMTEALGSEAAAHEVDRFIVWPGQATGYMVGMLKILELREKAISELGDLFDIKEFHGIVLGNGRVPLTILEKMVQEYIDANRNNEG
jgi:uncharacterized protein (DUF885 family)